MGWREWVALPAFDIRAIKAKVDTGARTSALHAHALARYTEGGVPRVRFVLYPDRRRSDLALTCEADVVDERWVTDSGGHREKRVVIVTEVVLRDLCFPVEMTITDRDSMRFRILLGRSAIRDRLLVDPSCSYLLGRPRWPRKP